MEQQLQAPSSAAGGMTLTLTGDAAKVTSLSLVDGVLRLTLCAELINGDVEGLAAALDGAALRLIAAPGLLESPTPPADPVAPAAPAPEAEASAVAADTEAMAPPTVTPPHPAGEADTPAWAACATEIPWTLESKAERLAAASAAARMAREAMPGPTEARGAPSAAVVDPAMEDFEEDVLGVPHGVEQVEEAADAAVAGYEPGFASDAAPRAAAESEIDAEDGWDDATEAKPEVITEDGSEDISGNGFDDGDPLAESEIMVAQDLDEGAERTACWDEVEQPQSKPIDMSGLEMAYAAAQGVGEDLGLDDQVVPPPAAVRPAPAEGAATAPTPPTPEMARELAPEEAPDGERSPAEPETDSILSDTLSEEAELLARIDEEAPEGAEWAEQAAPLAEDVRDSTAVGMRHGDPMGDPEFAPFLDASLDAGVPGIVESASRGGLAASEVFAPDADEASLPADALLEGSDAATYERLIADMDAGTEPLIAVGSRDVDPLEHTPEHLALDKIFAETAGWDEELAGGAFGAVVEEPAEPALLPDLDRFFSDTDDEAEAGAEATTEPSTETTGAGGIVAEMELPADEGPAADEPVQSDQEPVNPRAGALPEEAWDLADPDALEAEEVAVSGDDAFLDAEEDDDAMVGTVPDTDLIGAPADDEFIGSPEDDLEGTAVDEDLIDALADEMAAGLAAPDREEPAEGEDAFEDRTVDTFEDAFEETGAENLAVAEDAADSADSADGPAIALDEDAISALADSDTAIDPEALPFASDAEEKSDADLADLEDLAELDGFNRGADLAQLAEEDGEVETGSVPGAGVDDTRYPAHADTDDATAGGAATELDEEAEVDEEPFSPLGAADPGYRVEEAEPPVEEAVAPLDEAALGVEPLTDPGTGEPLLEEPGEPIELDDADESIRLLEPELEPGAVGESASAGTAAMDAGLDDGLDGLGLEPGADLEARRATDPGEALNAPDLAMGGLEDEEGETPPGPTVESPAASTPQPEPALEPAPPPASVSEHPAPHGAAPRADLGFEEDLEDGDEDPELDLAGPILEPSPAAPNLAPPPKPEAAAPSVPKQAEPEPGHEPGPRHETPPEPELPASNIVRYTCPRCGTPGTQDADKIGAIVSCANCGKAMRLTLRQ